MRPPTDPFGPLTASLREYALGINGAEDEVDRCLRDLAALAARDSLDPERRQDKMRLFRELHRLAADGVKTDEGRQMLFTPDMPRLFDAMEHEGLSLTEMAEVSGLSAVALARQMRKRSRTRGRRVFLIEDEYVLARDLQAKLENWGFQVLGSAASETSALAKMRGRDLDLIIADVSLRDRTSGIVAANRIRGNRDIPVIYLTANAHLVQPLNVSTRDRVLEKPLDTNAMFAAINSSLLPAAPSSQPAE